MTAIGRCGHRGRKPAEKCKKRSDGPPGPGKRHQAPLVPQQYERGIAGAVSGYRAAFGVRYLLSLCLKNPFSIIVYDIYPNALTNIGIKKTNFLYKKWEKWNNKLFAKADKIFTLSDGMKKQLSLYTNNDKIFFILITLYYVYSYNIKINIK